MTQEIAGSMMIALMLLSLALALWGWRRRVVRYRGEAEALVRDVPTSDAVFAVNALYVATTEAGDPLERVAAGPLSYRAKARLAVHPEGLVVRIPGEDAVVFPAEGLEAGRATWTIDRVVESDGLAMVRWKLAGRDVDSYFRIVDGDAGMFVDALGRVGKGTK
jgi:hypothetical protein